MPGKILAKVIEYCKFHVEANKKVDDKPAKSEDDIKQWDTEFVKVDQATLFDLILVRQLLLLCCCSHRSIHSCCMITDLALFCGSQYASAQ